MNPIEYRNGNIIEDREQKVPRKAHFRSTRGGAESTNKETGGGGEGE
jgi:hypothetical protein